MLEDPSSENGPGELTASGEANSLQQKLFNLRMKINQGRKANKTEVESEYKRFTDPRKNKQFDNDEPSENKSGKSKKGWSGKNDDILNQTAEAAEWEKSKAAQKEMNKATFGLNAYTTEASHRAYDKRLNKLPTNKDDENLESSLLENPLDYGKNNKVSKQGLERIQNDVVEREDRRFNFHKRRMHIDGADADNINDANAKFNKKLKRSYDRYTVEIRQNLERGTAI